MEAWPWQPPKASQKDGTARSVNAVTLPGVRAEDIDIGSAGPGGRMHAEFFSHRRPRICSGTYSSERFLLPVIAPTCLNRRRFLGGSSGTTRGPARATRTDREKSWRVRQTFSGEV